MSPQPSRSLGNRLLDALPFEKQDQLLPHLVPAPFSPGKVIYEYDDPLGHLYFPTTSVVFLLRTTRNGATTETGLVGNEGVVGSALLMGGETSLDRAVVQVAGAALKLNANAARYEFDRGGDFQHLLLRHACALMTQVSQTAVCNGLHSMEQRLCRWLLMCRDRAGADELQMTQEFLSNQLGVRREGVNYAAGGLQERGIISYIRGCIKILDLKGLKECACECYEVVQEEEDRLFRRYTERRVERDRRLASDRRTPNLDRRVTPQRPTPDVDRRLTTDRRTIELDRRLATRR